MVERRRVHADVGPSSSELAAGLQGPVPRSIAALDAAGRAKVRELQEVVMRLQRLQEERDRLVRKMREKGVSWAAIGWAVRTSGEAARQRWGSSSSTD